MGEIISGIFVVIWVIALISFIARIASGSKGQQRPGTPYTGTRPQSGNTSAPARPQVYDAQQESIDRARQAQNFRNVPGATYGSSNTGSSSARPRQLGSYSQSRPVSSGYSQNKNAAMFGQVKASRIGESAVLLEDRKNDWLAKQLREEAAILRKGSIYDLGASHGVNCDADRLKKDHIKRHNTNGLNRGMFR